eukprot:1028985-Pelagomonas_calceolata.AAC.1
MDILCVAGTVQRAEQPNYKAEAYFLAMLDRIRAYAERNGLTVNTSKSELFWPTKLQFKYLVMLVDKRMNLKVSEEHAVQPCMAIQQRTKKFVHEHDLKNRPRTLLWLSKVYGILAGTYAYRLWGTEIFQEGSEFKIQFQKRPLCSLRRFLGVKSTATNWPVSRECVQDPLHTLESNSETLCQALKADLHLADRNESCWSAHASKAFRGMNNVDMLKQRMLGASKNPMQDFIRDLGYRQHNNWMEADALCLQEGE